jgi:multiple sugar transport system permease protein
MWPMIVNTSPDKMTLAAGLSYLQGQYLTDYPSIMAGALLSIIPLIIIYAIFQKQFIEGIALTGIKG